MKPTPEATSDEWDEWVEDIRSQPRRDSDAVIIVVGREGKGKSTLAYRLGRVFDPDRFTSDSMYFTGRDFALAATKAPPGSVLVLDEAVDGGFSRDAMSKKNRDLVKFLIVCRQRNLIGVICFPNIKWLDSYIKDHRMDWLITLPKDQPRGVGILSESMPTDFRNSNPYEKARFMFRFGKVEGEDWEAYLKRKHEHMLRQALDMESGDELESQSGEGGLESSNPILRGLLGS